MSTVIFLSLASQPYFFFNSCSLDEPFFLFLNPYLPFYLFYFMFDLLFSSHRSGLTVLSLDSGQDSELGFLSSFYR